MDEMPIWFEMTGKTTVEKIRNKTIDIKKFGTERNRISLLLAVSASGLKLKSLIVFKGKYNSIKQSKLIKKIFMYLIKIYS